ncbi:hypothetical protein CGRA01v4_09938 [Colletotrichum graminicola]|nr:hypothetical protein CGRA01v4_09938 [Colletotrichum graminicola]
MVAQPLNTAARQEPASQPSGQGPTPTACIEVKELLERQDETTQITIPQTFPRTLSTRTATVTLHGGIPTEPPPRSSEGVSNQQLGAIIGGTCATILTLLLLGCWTLKRRRKNKPFVKSPRGGNAPFPSAPLRPSPWSPRSSTGPGGRQGPRHLGNTSPSPSGEDFLNDKYPPPPPGSGPPRPPPTYSRSPPGPIYSKTSPASENPKSPTPSGPGHIPHPPTAPVSSKYPAKFVPTAGNQRPSTNYSASWVPPASDRSGAYPVQPQPDSTLPSRSRLPSTFQSGPLKEGVTAMPRGSPLRTSTAPTTKPSVYIPIPPPAHRPKIVIADPEIISGSSSNIKHAPGFPGQGRQGNISSIGNTAQATSFRQPTAPVLPAPFNGLHREKKTVKFPDVPTESDLPSPEHTTGNKKSTLIQPSPRQNHQSNGGVKSTSPELQDEDQPEIPERPAESTPKSNVAEHANGQTSSPVESPSGMKSPATGPQSRVPSPEIINVDQEPPLEELNEPVTKYDDAEKVNVQPSPPTSHRSGSNISHSGAHPMTQSPTVIEVDPEPPMHQKSGSISHTAKHSKPRAPNTSKAS